MENIPSDIRPLSTPYSYRATNPAVLPLPPVSDKARLFERKRLIVGFLIAAFLHVALVVGWWLTPPLRLKASYAPERWVQVLPLLKPEPITKPEPVAKPEQAKSVVPAVEPESASATPKKKSSKSRKATPAATAPTETP